MSLALEKRPEPDVKKVLVEPIHRRQPEETDREYQLFLIYRDIGWVDRSIRKASCIACGKELKYPHRELVEACVKWQWVSRVEAWDLYVQEAKSDREEKVVMELKSKVEKIAFRLIEKIERIADIKDFKDIEDPEIRKEIAIVEALIGKSNAGKFLLEAYKTVIGEKIRMSKTTPELLQWKE